MSDLDVGEDGNAGQKRKNNSEYTPNNTAIKNILRLLDINEGATMTVEQVQVHLTHDRMHNLSEELRSQHPAIHSDCVKWCTAENIAGLLNNEAEKRRKLSNTPNVTNGNVNYMVHHVFPVVLTVNETLQTSAQYQPKDMIPEIGVVEKTLVSPIEAAERIMKLGFDGLREKGVNFHTGKNALPLDDRLHRRYFTKEFLTKVANKIYYETAPGEKKKVGRKPGNDPALLTQTSKAFSRSIKNSQRSIHGNNVVLVQKMNKLAELTVGSDMNSGMNDDNGNTSFDGHGSFLDPNDGYNTGVLQGVPAELDSLDEELGNHLRECKRIMGRMAEAEQPGEKPAVIATLTWGAEDKGGTASVDIAYDQANPPTARFLKRVKMWTDTLGSA